jgi:hypothetical protein
MQAGNIAVTYISNKGELFLNLNTSIPYKAHVCDGTPKNHLTPELTSRKIQTVQEVKTLRSNGFSATLTGSAQLICKP